MTWRAEPTKAKLGPVEEELKNIKDFPGEVCAATIGKLVLHLLVITIRLISLTCLSFLTGKKSPLNLEVPKIKLQALYMFIE